MLATPGWTQLKLNFEGLISLLTCRDRRMTMATKKSTKGKKVKVNKLKVEKGKVRELTNKDSKRIRGGVAAKKEIISVL